jgi:5'-3' exonuclease
MHRTLLIDADIVAFKFAAKGQRKYAFGVAVDPLETVTPKVDEWLAELKAELGASDLIICLSSPSAECWRKDVLPSYKENRTDVEKPVLLMALKEHMETNYPSYRKPRLEADDIMGILSTHPTLIAGERIIVSEDKDMKTIPGWLYNPAKDSKPRLISEKEADQWHLYQSIIGDTTDGYKGCPGAGPVKAIALLDAANELDEDPWGLIVELYARKGLTEDDALVQAQVARICRSSDYDFKTQKVILWQPIPISST